MISKRQFLPVLAHVIITVAVVGPTPIDGLKARWYGNGKKPAPFSKKYRDKHGIKSGEGSYGDPMPSEPPSNVKMLIFFAVCIGLWYYFTRKPSSGSIANPGGARASRSMNQTSGSSRTVGHESGSSRSSAATLNSKSNSASMREARLRALQNRQKNMDEALAASGTSSAVAGKNGNKSRMTSTDTVRHRKGVHGLHTLSRDDNIGDDKRKGNNYYTGGSASGQAVIGRPENDENEKDS